VRRLTAAGYVVQSVDCVQALFHRLEATLPDAIFLDVNLPDGNGFEVLATLRQHPSYTHLPIIMLTAEAKAEDIAKGLARGADGYVTKPYGANTLDYILRYVMKQEIDSWSTKKHAIQETSGLVVDGAAQALRRARRPK
jgi:DNA-binding response OmpR family regulator